MTTDISDAKSQEPRLPRSMIHPLRQRICLSDPSEEWLLHEGRLGQEFGVSRTPVRQVLQRLAFEGLVETRSGIGTVVTALDPALRDRDLDLLRGVLRLAQGHVPSGISLQMRVELAGLGVLAQVAKEEGETGAALFQARAGLLSAVNQLIPDQILAQCHEAMHWRVVRRRMDSAKRDLGGAVRDFVSLHACISAATRPHDVIEALILEQDNC